MLETFRITESESGQRIDKILPLRINARSRSYVQSLLKSGHVHIDGETPSKSHRAIPGELVSVHLIPTQRELPLQPEDIPLNVAYEDDHLIIINKPNGMVVHPAPGNWHSTLVHALSFHYPSIRTMGGNRPGIVHRLDKGTTGLVMAAKTEAMQTRLAELFARREVRKEYIAISVGNPSGEGCVGRLIDASLGRSPTDRLRMCVLPEEAGGKQARSRIEVCGHDDRGLLHAVRVGIETGRTHQIRVHLRHVRAPVLGDDLYGAVDINRRFCSSASRPMLHAFRLTFKHPETGEVVDVTAPLPDDMRSLMKRVVYPQFEEEEEGW